MKTLSEIAAAIGGQVVGDGDIQITGIKAIHEAGPGDLSFISQAKYEKELETTRASALIVSPTINCGLPIALIQMPNPYLGYARAIALLYGSGKRIVRGVDPRAVICEDVVLGAEVNIYPGAYIGQRTRIGDRVDIYPNVYLGEDVSIGNDCVLYANVSLYPRTVLGQRVILHSGVVIGSDGFGYTYDEGVHHKILQVGRVVVGDDVEIGANSTIDRATLGETVIGQGSKIDNLVQVGHNVKLGQGCILVAQCGISGSTQLGNYVTIAGQAGVAGHLNLGDGATIGGQAGVSGHVRAGERVLGSPAGPEMQVKRAMISFFKLPEMRRRLQELEEELERLKNDLRRRSADGTSVTQNDAF